MELVDIRISLDSEFKGCEKTVKLTQGENAARRLIITITEGGRVVHLDPETDTVIIKGIKPDKSACYNMAEIVDDKILYTVTAADTATAGTGLYQVQVFRTENEQNIIYQTVEFNIYVNENVSVDGEVEASDEYTALSALILRCGDFTDLNNRVKKIEHEIVKTDAGRLIYNGETEESSEAIDCADYDRIYFTNCVYGADIPVALLRYLRVFVDRWETVDTSTTPDTVEVLDSKQSVDVADYAVCKVRIIQEGSAYFKIDYVLAATTFYIKEVIDSMLETLSINILNAVEAAYVPKTRKVANLALSSDILTSDLVDQLFTVSSMSYKVRQEAYTEINNKITQIIHNNMLSIITDTLIDNYLIAFISEEILDILGNKTVEQITNLVFRNGVENYSAYQMALYNALGKTTILNQINALINDTHYTKSQVDTIVSALNTGGFIKVDELPETGTEKYIYLVPKEDEEERNIYEEYIWFDEEWEKIGDTAIDLSGYATLSDLSGAVSDLTDAIAAAETAAKNASVPTSRTIAGLALSSDITKSAITQEILKQIPNEGSTFAIYMMPFLTNTYFYSQSQIDTMLESYTKIYTASSMPADILSEWSHIKAGDMINITGTSTMYLVKSVTTTTVTLEEIVKSDDVIHNLNGIKVYVNSGTPTNNLSDYPGINSGDIYYASAGHGSARTEAYYSGMYMANVPPGANPSLSWKKIVFSDDVYTKSEVDTLLAAKQSALTAGNNINIDSNNVISYQESEWKLLKTVEATEDNPLGEIIWQASDLVNGTYDDIMVKATNVQGNTAGNYAFQCKTTANPYNAGLFGVLLASGLSSTVARNFFTKIERLNNTTEFELTSWYIDNYLNKENSVIYTAPDLVATNPSHKLYYVRFYFSSTNTIKSGTFKIYGRKRIYGTS